VPATAVAGEIRIWGSPADQRHIEALGAGLFPPATGRARACTYRGPESTIAGVYTGVADIAVMARELREPMERMAFEEASSPSPSSSNSPTRASRRIDPRPSSPSS
jgi:phosphate transport system substrate-binding protein